MNLDKKSFGAMPDGRSVEHYTLTNKNGIRICVITYGATVTEVSTHDKNGTMENIVLGFDSLDEYREKSPFFGFPVASRSNW